MLAEFERRKIENDLVTKETRFNLIFSMGILFFVFVCGIVAYLLKRSPYPAERIRNVWQVMNVLAVLMVIVVLAVRKTIYFSPRRIKGEFRLSLILKTWRRIDQWLLSCPVIVALLGLAITIIGMPFSNTFHFFVTAALLTMILMPIPWKVKDKIRYFEKFVGRWNE